MTTKTDRKWTRSMTLEEQIRLMTDAEINMNAKRGGPAAKKEKQRRESRRQFEAEIPPRWAAADEAPRIRRLEAIRNAAHTDIREQIIPDHKLDIGV